MKHALRIVALAVLAPMLLLSPPATGQASDPYQRAFTFKNSLPITIYPLIEAQQTSNCAIGGLLRIIVRDAGLAPGESVTVTLPKTQPCTIERGPFYDAARMYISVAPIKPFESVNKPDQVTQPLAGWDYTRDPLCDGCWIGKATGAYGLDGPSQLIEYTIFAQDPANGAAYPNPNQPGGTPFIDFDISYVDHTYLPVAMALTDGGATQFMGSTIDYATFNQRSKEFIESKSAQWALFGTFAPDQWATPDQCPTNTGPPNSITPTAFSCMSGPRTDRIPSAAGITTSINGVSQYYQPVFDPKTSPPRECGAAENLKCSAPVSEGGFALPPNNPCCPSGSATSIGPTNSCCRQQNFIVEGTTFWWFSKYHQSFQNDAVNALVQRLDNWTGANDPCAGGATAPGVVEAPTVDKPAFCAAFKRTADYVRSIFQPQCQSFPLQPIGEPPRFLPLRGAALDRCITTAFIAYDLKKSGYNPDACKAVCPGPHCPQECVVNKLRTESVQALQRGVPWGAYGDPATCTGCPSGDASKCPAACIYPDGPASLNATIYQNDGFLHFWPRPESLYSINPYARFVHNLNDGLAAPGAYSFSIDDFYGNFGGQGSGLIIEVGGTTLMPNPEPFDPYQRYTAAFGPGWDHVEVCGRKYPAPPGKLGFSVPLSFWNNRVHLQECLVKAFASTDDSQYAVYRLIEVSYTATDTYTNLTHPVKGLQGAFATQRGDNDPVKPDPYCSANSTLLAPIGQPLAECNGNLAPGGDNLDYVGITNAKCTAGLPASHYDGTCGKPLIAIALPPFTAP